MNRNRILSGNIEIELPAIASQGEGRFASIRVEVNAYRDLFRQDQVDESKRIRQGGRQILPGPDAMIDKLQLQPGKVHNSRHSRKE